MKRIILCVAFVLFYVQESVHGANLTVGNTYIVSCINENKFIRLISAKFQGGADATAWMTNLCGNKQECRFTLSKNDYAKFGSYMIFNYYCGASRSYLAIGLNGWLSCNTGVMNILMASFGSEDLHCTPTVDAPLACANYTRLDYVRNLCQGKTGCLLQGNEELYCCLFNASPKRHLIIEYTCGLSTPFYPNLPNINCPAVCSSLPSINPLESAATSNTYKEAKSGNDVMAENENDVLFTCPSKMLLINSAIYVPTTKDQHSCPPTDITNILGARCNYKKDCRLSINKMVLAGDPDLCPHQNKSLIISFTCSKNWYLANICEHQRSVLHCLDAAVLIKESMYQNGRDITSSMKTMCQNQEKCEITPCRNEPGPNCKTSGKYLKVIFGCVPKKVTVCEGGDERVKMNCATGLLDIKSAFYGRAEQDTCPGPRSSQDYNLLCFKQSQFHQVSNMCHGKRECSFNVNKSVFGDPCPGYSKYLQVHYYCHNRTEPKPERFLLCKTSEDFIEEWANDLCTHFLLEDTVDPATFSVTDEYLLTRAKGIIKRNKNLKVLISLDIESINNEQKYISECLTFLRSHGLGGVVINPSFDKDKKHIKLSNFLHSLNLNLDLEGYLLGYEYTVTDDTNTWLWQDSRKIAENVDFFILTMEPNEPEGKVKIINPLYAPLGEASLSYLVDQAVSHGISREKIVLSLNAKAVAYDLETTPTPNKYLETGIKEWTNAPISICCKRGTWNNTWKCFWDDNAKIPFVILDKLLISYENHFSIDEKMMLVESRDLRGVAFSPETEIPGWDCGGRSYPLLRAIRDYATVLPSNIWNVVRDGVTVVEL